VLNEEKDSLRTARSVNAEIPEGFSQLLHRAMSLNANLRPQSTSEMRELLAEIEETGLLRVPTTSAEGKATSADSPPAVTAKSELKTMVLPSVRSEQDSIKTKIVRSDTAAGFERDTTGGNAPPPRTPNRGRWVAASVLAGGVLIGSLTAGVYLVKPGLFGSSQVVGGDSKSEKSKSVKKLKEAELVDTDSMNLDVNVKTPEAKPEANSVTIVSPPPRPKKVETTRKDASNNEKKKTQLAKDRLKTGDRKIVTKDATVKKGKIINGNIVIQNKDVRKKQPLGLRRRRFPMTKKEFDKLTPAQKRKVRQLMDRRRRLDRQRRNRRKRPPPPRKRY